MKAAEVDSIEEVFDSYDTIFADSFKSEMTSTKISQIDYFFINLPDTLTRDPRRLIKAIVKSNRIDIFENSTIQTIINFKWEAYTRRFYIK